LRDLGLVLADVGHAVEHVGVVVVVDVEELDGRALERAQRAEHVVGEERQVLDARALVLLEVLVDLALLLVASLMGMQKLPQGERSAYEVSPVWRRGCRSSAPR
jgi:hypothetical protein